VANSVYVAIAGEMVNRRSVLPRNFVLNGQVSVSNPLLHIHVIVVGKARKTTQHMDTNDLSRETHTAIIDAAERFNHDLTLQFGVLASDCKTDNEYLDQSESMIKEWLTDWDLEEVIMDIFFDDKPRKQYF
jgi:hypothetical protein